MFLPITKADMTERGWEQCDFIFVSGDAYVDHPSFGTALLTRLLERAGYRVGVIAQPEITNRRDITALGTPKLGFLISGGTIDSMVAHYTAAKRRRSEDAYTPGNKAGKRPDRATEQYAQLIRKHYPDSFIVIGGVEASLRRFSHYDYWEDGVRPSILISSGADVLVYGMGEKALLTIAEALKAGERERLYTLRGICYLTEDSALLPQGAVALPSHRRVTEDKKTFARAHALQYREQDAITGAPLVQKQDNTRFLVQMPPEHPLATEELDSLYTLPFERRWHPCYDAAGGIKALEEVEFSLCHNRGCFGECAFCSIAFHQGRVVTARSHQSVVEEAKLLTKSKNFKGYIHDVGGPTANFRTAACKKQYTHGACKGKRCLSPTPCKNLEVSHRDYRALLEKLRTLPGVKKVFVRSGVRFDYVMLDQDRGFLRELCLHHVSGQLKVAPEHCANHVLSVMGKPPVSVYKAFSKAFYAANKSIGKEQYLVPYLMSSHPGSRMEDAVELALFLKENRIRPEQVQDFYPTPGSTATCSYYTGLDPFTLKPIYVPKTAEEKAMQRSLLQYFKSENYPLVRRALWAAGRGDLIGHGAGTLVPPAPRRDGGGYTRPQSPPTRPPGGNAGKGKGGANSRGGAAQGKGGDQRPAQGQRQHSKSTQNSSRRATHHGKKK